jgi:hypothetical protein
MKAITPFDVIAQRELNDGAGSKVIVELGQPKEDERGGFGCSYRIAFGEREAVRTIFGVDAFPAMALAIKFISADLNHSDRLPTGPLFWLDPSLGTGFSEFGGP